METEFKNILYTKDNGIARITVNRPEVRNAMDRGTREELRLVLADIEKDENVRVAILTGGGDKVFVSGADIRDLKGMTPVAMETFANRLGQQLYTDLGNMCVPVLAMINGLCLGGGLELAMACDMRIASRNAQFGQPEINLGFFPGGGGTQRLPRLVGIGRAKELIYTGRIINADEAEHIGLVDRVVPPEDLNTVVNGLAENIARKSPLTIRLVKKTIDAGMRTDLASGLCQERANLCLCFATEDCAEGISAFLEKRAPKFKGR
ncbi:MAG: enoyl-CoA hydratase-related protein [Smithellaceae bacterium]